VQANFITKSRFQVQFAKLLSFSVSTPNSLVLIARRCAVLWE